MNYSLCRQIFLKFHPKELLIGFSGGADSTALLEMIRDLQPDFHYAFTAIHFNHHLRGAESDQEAADAELFCSQRHLAFQLVDLDVDCAGNLENAARAARLDAWKKLVAQYRADAVFLAHHADDRLENLLLRLGRGANTSGATALRASTTLDGIRFYRPLLEASKEEIIAFLARRGITHFAEDSSNADCRYLRNHLRCRILPELYTASPGGRAGFLASLDALEKDASFIEEAAMQYFQSKDPDSLDFWRNAHLALRPRLLRLFVQQQTAGDFLPTGGDCRRFNEELARESHETRRVTLSGGITLVFTRENLALETQTPPPAVWDWRAVPTLCWGNWQISVTPDDGTPCTPDEARFDQATLPARLVVAAPLPGETMTVFGGETPEKLKKLRVDRKLAAFPALPVLHDEKGRVIWFANVRQSDLHTVAATSGATVRFKLQKLPLFQHEDRADGK